MAICPYCQREMKKGDVECDSRSSLRWVEEGKKRSIISKMRDKDCIVLAKRDLIANSIKIDANYCEICKKVIIDIK
jgi:hypothetical protein